MKIKLYASLSCSRTEMTGNDYENKISPNTNTTGDHKFTLTRHEDKYFLPIVF